MRTRLMGVCGMAMAVALVVSPAAAQDGVLDMTGMGIYAMEESVMQAARETVSEPARTTPRLAPTSSRLTFQPSLERRRENAARFVAKSQRRDPQGAALLQRQLAQDDVLGKMERALAGYGMRTHDVGDAYAAWWMSAWLATRGRDDDPSPRQIAAVRAQAAEAMTRAGLDKASDAIKQEVAEAHLIQAALIGAHMASAKGDPRQIRLVAAAVAQGARGSGLDLQGMRLTDEGFAPKGR